MIIQHNIMALNSYNRLSGNNSLISKNLEKLSSGYKINRAGDDAAGLAISEKMRAQITGLTRATQNSQDGISLVQTAEGNLTEVHSMLNRMVDLATQSSNGTIDNDVDRKNLQKEVQSLKDEINRIADSSHFNGIKLLDGSQGNGGATADVLFGSTKVSFSAKRYDSAVSGTADKVQLLQDDTLAAGSITANFTTAGEVQIKVGGLASTSYTSEQITQAVRDAARAYLDAKDADGTFTNKTATKRATAENMSSFTMKADGKINVIKGSGPSNTTSTALGRVGVGKGGLSLQIGDTAAQRVTVQVGSMDIASLGLQDIDVSTEDGAVAAIDKIKTAINTVSGTRADLGAIQNRLEHTINNLSTTTENMTAAESRIRDTDMAKEMMAFTKNNVLSQAAQSMLAQANQQPQQVLQLLR